jgi:hypothetical protein
MTMLNDQLQILGAVYGRANVTAQLVGAIDWGAMPNTVSIGANNATFGDSWPGVQKTLTVVFRYGADGAALVKSAREGETLTLGMSDYTASRNGASTAPPTGGPVLTVWGASYGPADVTSVLRGRIGAGQALAFTADNATFGDSWPGVPKGCVVVSSYSCCPIETEVIVENAVYGSEPSTALEILGAAYGLADATARAAQAVDRNADPDTLALTADNGTFGDSWPGFPKTLTVVYRYGSDGAPGVKVAREGEALSIGAADQLASRIGASTATGVPGTLTVYGASYGPANVTAAVSGWTGSDQVLSFTADNATFGDSWPGVRKTCVLVSAYDGQAPGVTIVEEGSACVKRPG